MNYQEVIRKLYKSVFNEKIINLQDKSKGLENKVFLIETDNENTVLKISARVDDLAGKYQVHREAWAAKACAEIKLPVPRIIVFDNSRKLANFDYVIESRINGVDLSESMLSDSELKRVMRHVGKLLKQMHGISAEGFGALTGELKGHAKSWRYLRKPINRLSDGLFNEKIVTKKQSNHIANYFLERESILDFDDPRLLHNDIQKNNLMVNQNKLVGIIDLGDAMAGDPVYDLARAYQGLCDIPYRDELLNAYGDFDMESFNYYLLYHACWTTIFFHKNNFKGELNSSLDLLNKLLCDVVGS